MTLNRNIVTAWLEQVKPGWTTFEASNGAKGIVPQSPGYPTGCITLGYTWDQVARRVRQQLKAAEGVTYGAR